MERNKVLWQGTAIAIFGAFFIILASVLHVLNYIKGDRVFVFYGLSIFLVAIGVVLLLLSKRTPQQSVKVKRKKT
jgi:hypothetical protein